MTDTVMVAIIGGLFGIIGGAIGSVLAYKNQKPITQAQSDRSALQDSEELRKQIKIEREEYRSEYRILKEKFDALEEQLDRVQNDLTHERAARVVLESKQIEAQVRISALEDEVDKREKRIRELEGNTGIKL
jgi:predicted RNase H-like nuclease (RuvC/YqgF family)